MNRRTFIKGILALAVIPQIPFIGVEEIVQPDKLKMYSLIELAKRMKHDNSSIIKILYTENELLKDIEWIPTGRTA